MRVGNTLWWCGALSLPLYGAVLFLSFRFNYGGGYLQRPVLAVLAMLGAASVLYLIAARAAFQRRPWENDPKPPLIKGGMRRGDDPPKPPLTKGGVGGSSPEHHSTSVPHSSGYTDLRVVIFFAVIFRMMMLPSNPIQEIDYCRYLWDGRVLLNGHNPYQFSPEQVELAERTPPGSEEHELRELADSSPAMRELFRRIHFKDVPTIYPPASQAVFAFCAWVTPVDAPYFAHLWVWRLVLMAFDIGTLLLLASLLRRLRLPVVWCVVYGWCPLVVKEFANSAHLDAIAVFFTLLGLRLVVVVRGRGDWKWAVAGSTVLGVAVLAKNYPLALVPAVGAFLIARLGWRSVLPMAVAVAVMACGYLPFRVDRGHSSFEGLMTFLAQWENNDFLFRLAHENIRPPGEDGDRWFVVTPESWREGLLGLFPESWKESLPRDTQPSLIATRILLDSLVILLAFIWAVGVFFRPTRVRLLATAGLTLAWAWLLSPVQHPWYLTWALPLFVFFRYRSWLLLACCSLLYYLVFWMRFRGRVEEFDYGWVWLEYGPFFVALLTEAIIRLCCRRKSDGPH